MWLPPALIGFIAVYAYAKTARYHLPTDLEWPGVFGPAHQLGWLAVALTAVLALTGDQDSGQTQSPPTAALAASRDSDAANQD